MIRALFLAALMLTALPAAADEHALQRLITVTGTGEAVAVPDMARVSVGVTTEGETAEAALSANSAAMIAVLAQIAGAGVAERDVATSGLSLSPIWGRTETEHGRPRIDGYRAANMVSITARDLDALGALLDRLTKAGATDISSISFDLSNREALTDEARRGAIADARRKAALYAEAAGVTLGQVIRIGEAGFTMPQPEFDARMAMAESAAVPIARGEQTVSATITVIFGIE